MITPKLLAAAALLAAHLGAQNCARTSVGLTPLDDLGPNTYQGFTGGLYPGGANVRPPAHQAAGLARAAAIQPLDAAGNPDPQGRIVLLSIGMSNTTQEFSAFLQISNADPQRNPRLTVVDGAQGGQDARRIADPGAQFWTNIDARLAAAGVTAHQVQALWIKEAIAGPNAGFPAATTELRDLLGDIVRIVKSRYAQARIAYLSSRIYAGYATTALNPEPYAYESAFAVKWLIDDQIAGRGNLNHDPANGTVVAPWLAWGPYLWADGLVPRSDGLTWECSDFAADGTHPGPAGRAKVAAMLNGHFRGDDTATPWYLGGGGGSRAAVVAYGAGCPGGNGLLEVRHPSLPYLGNMAFSSQVGRGAADSPAGLLLAASAADLRLAGSCRLLVGPTAIWALPLRTNAQGRAGLQLTVPADPALGGQSAFAQWLVVDPLGTPFLGVGLSLSSGFEWRLGQP